MSNKNELFKDFKFFESQLDELLKSDSDKFAIIKDQKIIKICDSKEDALKFTESKKLKLGTFLIQKISKDVQYISRLAVVS